MRARRPASFLLALSFVLVSSAWSSASTASGTNSAFSKTERITRDHLVDGTDQVVDKRTVTVSASETHDLRDRQAITITWKGAHPTGGLVTDDNSAAAAQQEYPVVVMQCRGVDSTAVATANRVTPQTCWTQTPDERFQYSPSGFSYPAYRMDRYAPTEDRAFTVGRPAHVPADCSDVAVAYWVPFRAADGTVYGGGNLGCAGLAPEAANAADSLQPGNTTYGVADGKGNGSTKFVVDTNDTNASLGCSVTVACTVEVIPIMGISCDAAGTAPGADRGLPAADRPDDPALIDKIFTQCSRTGHFPPGTFNGGGEVPDLPVSGALWWAPSNWQNRISIPVTFAPSTSACDVVSSSSTAYLYGSEALLQATQQWSPRFCLDPKLFSLRHVQTSEPQAKNLLNVGNIPAAIQAGPPATPFVNPTLQVPAAVTGFAIAYSVDGADGQPVGRLNLDARLLAKLLSESYRSCATCLDFASASAKQTGFAKMATNPIDMSTDPEFQALNPGIPATLNREAGAALAVMSSDSDEMTALTSYLNADPEARAWLDGKPDPWGMVVNPAYKRIVLPVDNWPLLDNHIAQFSTGANQCLSANPVPWLPLVAAPVSNPAAVALNMQFDIANAQVSCKNNGAQNQKLAAIGREPAGGRFLIGLVSLADARRYQINVASLQSHSTSAAFGRITSATGRTFVAPDDAGLRAAAALLKHNNAAQTWTLQYSTMRTSSAGASAYPGALLMSIDLPTTGLSKPDAQNYATLLRFVAGAGQHAGLAVGDLPPGYLPLTAANDLADELAFTDRAAGAVAAQRGATWPLNPPPPTTHPTPSPTPTTQHHSSARATVSSNPQPVIAGGKPSAGPPPSSGSSMATSKPTASASPSPSSSAPSSAQAQAVAHTSDVKSGALAFALPVLTLLALVTLGTVGWLSGVGRR